MYDILVLPTHRQADMDPQSTRSASDPAASEATNWATWAPIGGLWGPNWQAQPVMDGLWWFTVIYWDL